MQIKKVKLCNKWMYGDYDFCINNHIVAMVRTPIVGIDSITIYFLPELYKNEYAIKIDTRYMTEKETLDKITKIVQKKLYLFASNILSDIQTIEKEE